MNPDEKRAFLSLLEEKEKRQFEFDKLKTEVAIAKKTLRYWWLPIGISIASVAIAIVIPLYLRGVDESDKFQTKQQMQDIEKKIESNKRESLNFADSLYKVSQGKDTAKTKYQYLH